MKFYFAAHTKKLDQYFPVYEKILNTLQKSGWKNVDNWLKREMKAQKDDKGDYYDYYKNLYDQTSKRIKSSDVLIAEISEKSTTVAQQIVYALENSIPVWSLYQKSREHAIPAFIKTRKDKKLTITSYNDGDLEKVFDKGLSSFSRRKIKFNFYLTQEMNDYLEKASENQKAPKSEVIRKLILREMKNTK